ncbi:MAG: molybdenum cofactor guanylyltransferase MobA [Alcaligenaceae bacterium]|nr:molybdenum cofactor guanylyltransferase MobA [Alcaligenaceae bacterium]
MAELTTALPSFAAVILAGGLGRRMGYQQKGLMQLNQRPLIDYVLDRVRPYTGKIVISANQAMDSYAQFSYPVVSDLERYTQRGPLAGIYSAMMSLPNHIEFIQILPCDTPYLPDDLILNFYHYLQAHDDKDLVIAMTEDKEHPVIMQCRRSVIPKLKAYLDDPRLLNRVMSFIRSCNYGIIQFNNNEQFTNINDPSLLEV